MAIYVDSSAIVKLAVREPESAALHSYLRRRLGDEVRALVTYDVRMAEAARQLDYRVVSPD